MKAKEPAYYKLPITNWPESERPREKLMKLGPFKLTDTEILAILVRSGSGDHSALDVAREILTRSGGLSRLVKMDYNDILGLGVRGIGKTKAVTIVAAMQLVR
ncbi:MAG: hypothetical protein KAX28_12325, partial [Candidatus Marinimicrobia bacterium]|nr:hypothetical protein [Candidatus Neomarinimicrobiota bacterium]